MIGLPEFRRNTEDKNNHAIHTFRLEVHAEMIHSYSLLFLIRNSTVQETRKLHEGAILTEHSSVIHRMSQNVMFV